MFSGQLAIHASGDRVGARPAHVVWQRIEGFSNSLRPQPIWFTDGSMALAERWHELGPGHTTIGLLLEPPELHPENTKQARRLLNDGNLDVLFTHQPQVFAENANRHRVKTYPLGGTRIHENDWRLEHGKEHRVIAIVSEKRALPGHLLRHEVASFFRGEIEVYGPEHVTLPRNAWGHDSKIEVFRRADFALAIEAVNTGVILSEHTLDCFLTGTMPIFWGPPNAIAQHGFDPAGIIYAEDRDELFKAVRYALAYGRELLRETIGSRTYNFIHAHDFVSPEDWLWRQYPELFV